MSFTINRLDRDVIESMFGYRPFTTFWEDFSLAEPFGVDAILDTYNRAFKEWNSNYKYVTELSLILNWKSWYFSEKNDPKSRLYSRIYADLWSKTDNWCCENLTGEDLKYYYRTTD